MTTIHHVALAVADPALSEVFYSGLFGWPVAKRWYAEDGALRSVWLHLPDGALLMLERGLGDAGPGGWRLVAFTIALAERDLWRRKCAAAGASICGETVYSLYFNDRDGNRVGLSHWPDAVGGESESKTSLNDKR